ncbi:hypothetical protein AB0J38_07490 [Streptomyces sp. NPDC050095]|uniref:hypothetical protein n=1 Tax=unclassified Streptomyces TaxID=2593676 RepID=UPI00343F2CEF
MAGPASTSEITGSAQSWRSLPSVRTAAGADAGGPVDATVVADPEAARQQYSGIGFSLDETSVSNLWKLTPAKRRAAIRLLVDPVHGAGLDRFRLTIGSPDLIEHLPFWFEDGLPAGVKDAGEVALKPGSSTEYYQVGTLRDDCIDVFARYCVTFVQAYANSSRRTRSTASASTR